jgi:DNA-binding winged helix-turn-helix (wHTH) protein/tetratricopeptide (TPR) repeat protein
MKYVFGEFELNPATRELSRNGLPVALRPRSLECLVYLIQHRDRAVGRDELVAAVWGKVEAGDTVVAQTLLRARKALDDTGTQQGMIRTVPRFGYRWVAPVREVATHDPEDDRARGEAGQGYAADVVLPAAADYAAIDGVDASRGDVDRAYDAEAASTVDEGDVADAAEGEWATAMPVAEVDAVAPGAAERTRRLPRFAIPLGLAFLLLLAIGLGWFLHRRAGNPPAANAKDVVLVMPVEVTPMDSENAWVRLGAMDYMATRLRASGIDVLPSEEALRIDKAIAGDAPATAREKLRSLSGARRIALPQMRREGKDWSIRLRVFGAGPDRTIEARGDTALAAAAGAADAWLRQMGEQGEAGPPPGPLAERLHRIDAEILAGHLTEARRLVRSASPAERSDPRFLLLEGKLEFRVGNFDAAGQRFQQALDRAPKDDRDTTASALLGLGNVSRASGDLDAADKRYSQALDLLASMPAARVNARLLGIAYQGRGIVRAERGDLDASVEDMGQARVWLQRSGDLITLATIGHNLGNAEALRGDYLQALREFDRSIDTFERFGVADYLANSLRGKAEALLALARPAEARDAMARVDALVPKLEDDGLVAEVLLTKAKVLIATGRLQEADRALADSRARGMPDADPRMRELRLRLALARGDTAQARTLAADAADTEGASGGLLLAGVQAALRGRDPALAKAWLARAPRDAGANPESVFAVALAQALVDRASGQSASALAQAGKAAGLVEGRGSPDNEIQAGLLRAMLLLDTRQAAAASAIMGQLEKYSETDYRVAWGMSRLYRALGDAQAVATAEGRARALAGERDIAVEPVL